MEDNKKAGINVQTNYPWSLTKDDLEIIKEFNIKVDKISDTQVNKMKEQIKNNINNLKSDYYSYKAQMEKTISETISAIERKRIGELESKSDVVSYVAIKILNFLYGSDYKDISDRKLPENISKTTSITQGEYIEFIDKMYDEMRSGLKKNYEDSKNKIAEENIINEIKIKMIYSQYHERIFESNIEKE